MTEIQKARTTTLNNRTYGTVLDAAGQIVVIAQKSPLIWRVASPKDRAKVLAGLNLPVLQVVR
jgi:hypothetical protein